MEYTGTCLNEVKKSRMKLNKLEWEGTQPMKLDRAE